MEVAGGGGGASRTHTEAGASAPLLAGPGLGWPSGLTQGLGKDGADSPRAGGAGLPPRLTRLQLDVAAAFHLRDPAVVNGAGGL